MDALERIVRGMHVSNLKETVKQIEELRTIDGNIVLLREMLQQTANKV